MRGAVYIVYMFLGLLGHVKAVWGMVLRYSLFIERSFGMNYIIITCVCNAEEWIARNIQSLKFQTARNFRCVIIDDLSTDATVAIAVREIAGDARFTLIRNTEKKYCLRNTVEGVTAANPAVEDVILLVDGDDWLPHERVLERLHKEYADPDCWMTYGSCAHIDAGGVRHPDCQPYPDDVLRIGRIRRHIWRGHPLRTFRYSLWQYIPQIEFAITQTEIDGAVRRALLTGSLRSWFNWRKVQARDLHESSGQYVRRATDKAMMFPLLELSGHHARFINEVLYIFHYSPRPLPYDRKDISGRWFPRLTREVLIHRPRRHQPLVKL